MEKGGKLLAGDVVRAELGPFATAAEMEGSFCVTKLPQIVMKARTKSGP